MRLGYQSKQLLYNLDLKQQIANTSQLTKAIGILLDEFIATLENNSLKELNAQQYKKWVQPSFFLLNEVYDDVEIKEILFLLETKNTLLERYMLLSLSAFTLQYYISQKGIENIPQSSVKLHLRSAKIFYQQYEKQLNIQLKMKDYLKQFNDYVDGHF